MIILIIFLVVGFFLFWLYFFEAKNRFSLAYLFLGLWALALGVSQLRLSPWEKIWSNKFWLVLVLFFLLFYLIYSLILKAADSTKRPKIDNNLPINQRIFLILISVLTILSVIANFYIFWRFKTLPIISTLPDKMRFIINREVFGLWEYLALLPRLIIPFVAIYLLAVKTSQKIKIILTLNLILGFLILGLYASRLIIVLAILLSYFAYLIINQDKIKFKNLFRASLLVLILVLFVSAAIPGLRHYLTYRDYQTDLEYTPFTYLADLSQIKMPKNLQFLIPLYLAPSFNLTAFNQSLDFYSWSNFYFGRYSLTTLDSALKIVHLPTFAVAAPWKEIFLPWWVTATFLFNYWADFGWLGIVLAALIWAAVLALIYLWVRKKPTFLSVVLFAYFNFIVIMTIYTNYFLREEFYLDLVLIFLVGFLVRLKTNSRPPAAPAKNQPL